MSETEPQFDCDNCDHGTDPRTLTTCNECGGTGRRTEPQFVSLMHGDGWQRCCICFELHEAPFDGLAVDQGGARWDVCKSDCAREAGIVEVESG